jgi:L-lysine 6-oxidase
MAMRYAIHPSIGVARVGDAEDFYLAPVAAGGLPLECDRDGNAGEEPERIRRFKSEGRIRRQAARFSVFRYDEEDGEPEEVTAATPGVASLTWTVHLANKKAAWFRWNEEAGDTTLGVDNSYAALKSVRRNEGTPDRRTLLVDPGPRVLDRPSARTDFSRASVPPGYAAHFPEAIPKKGTRVETLGEMLTDARGRLLVVGGFGDAGGPGSVTDFIGADGWFDDVADGPVTCELCVGDERFELDAWCIVAQPNFAPELVNVVTFDDVLFDLAVRCHGILPELFDPSVDAWNDDFVVDYERDVAPIFERARHTMWVANVPSLLPFACPAFDLRDPSEANRRNRERHVEHVRTETERFFSAGGAPLFPANAGDNPLSNAHASRFLVLTATQQRILRQWARGQFTTVPSGAPHGVHPLDRAATANCVGGPLSPGVEVSWSIRNPRIYSGPWRVKHRFPPGHYLEHGLDPDEDETDGRGCEPGDLTKRMNVPWMADFFQCTSQPITLDDAQTVDDGGFPIPPTYYAYWWPPQSPIHVLSGARTAQEQEAAGVAAGAPVIFMRGINSFDDAVAGWKYLGFVANQNLEDGAQYPYFAEVERNHDQFVKAAVALGDIANAFNANDITFSPMFFMKPQPRHAPVKSERLLGRRRLAVRF